MGRKKVVLQVKSEEGVLESLEEIVGMENVERVLMLVDQMVVVAHLWMEQ